MLVLLLASIIVYAYRINVEEKALVEKFDGEYPGVHERDEDAGAMYYLTNCLSVIAIPYH